MCTWLNNKAEKFNISPTLLQTLCQKVSEEKGHSCQKMVSCFIMTTYLQTQRSWWSSSWPRNTSQYLTSLPVHLIQHHAAFFLSPKSSSALKGNSFGVCAINDYGNRRRPTVLLWSVMDQNTMVCSCHTLHTPQSILYGNQRETRREIIWLLERGM